MSKFFARTYMWSQGIDKYQFREVMNRIQPKVKYLATTKEFHFSCLDVSYYLRRGTITKLSFKISEKDISRFFKMDNIYKGTPESDMPYKMIKEQELEGLEDFYDDVYFGICFLQQYYFLSKKILKMVKRQNHIYRLHRADTPWYELSLIPINRNGGRKAGLGFNNPRLNREEKETLLDNLSRYDQIVEHYAASDVSLLKFIKMHKDLSKLGNLLPEKLQKSFMRSEEGLTWYWHSIRYNYEVKHGLETNPGLQEILEQQVKYNFPFEPME